MGAAFSGTGPFEKIARGIGIYTPRQGERSRAHSGALNVSEEWIFDRTTGPVAGLAVGPRPSYFRILVFMACAWLNSSCNERFKKSMLVVGWSYGYNFTVTAPAAHHRCASRTRDGWVEGETRRGWLVRWETQEILIPGSQIWNLDAGDWRFHAAGIGSYWFERVTAFRLENICT
jgi:hypothetical protein